jgi:hypothetical protein
MPDIVDGRSWPFGLIVSADKIERGAEMAEELYRVGIRWFHFDYSIGSINSVGASSDPDAGKISDGFASFVDRASELGLNPIFKLMSHYSQISGPTDLNGDFYAGLRKIQTYYRGKLRYWTIGNEVEGGGYSRFTPEQYAAVIRNMSIVLKGADPGVQIVAGEFYSADNQHLDMLLLPEYRDYWDVLSGHNVVRVGAGNSPVSAYLDTLGGLDKPFWDTEANGTIFGGPSEWSNYMQSRFPVVEDSDLHSGINKHIVRAFCLETRNGEQWLPAFYDPDQPCLGVDLFIAMHYNANWETLWALRRHWINSVDQPSEQNHKVAGFRTVADMLYGTQGVTRIPNTDVADPYNASPTAEYKRADGYVYRYGAEYILILWQNSGDGSKDREMILTTDDAVVMYDSLGNRYPLRNEGGQVKVWVRPDAVYLRGFTSIPTFALDQTDDDDPYFVTIPITRAVVGQTYYYDAWAYDSDTPGDDENSLPRITYSLVEAPGNMRLAVNTTDGEYANRAALVEWTPSAPGVYSVRLRATSEQGARRTVDQAFSLHVVPADQNLAPEFVSQPTTQFGRVNTVWWYNVNAYDPNGEEVSYALAQAPPGMTIDAGSGFVQWTPQQDGLYPVTVVASDGQAYRDHHFTIRVGDAASAPVVSKSAFPRVANAGDVVTFTLSIAGTGRPLTVTDVLPTQFDHLETVTSCALGTLTYDGDAREVLYAGDPAAGSPCTVEIAARVSAGQRGAVVNTAEVADDLGGYEVSAVVLINGLTTYLPTILRE